MLFERTRMARLPSCEACRGACCEDLVFPEKGLTIDAQKFLGVRGKRVALQVVQGYTVSHGYSIPCKCPELTDGGRCGIYFKRPAVCAAYAVGGPACLATIARLRTPEEQKRIFGEED